MKRLMVMAERVRTPAGMVGGGVVIEGGRVIEIGTGPEHTAAVGEVHRYPGGVIVPALTDHHFHPIGYAAAVTRLSLKEVVNIRELHDVLAAEHRRLPEGAALVGVRLDDETLAEARLPTRQELDLAAPGRPVLLLRYCGHVAAASTVALEIGGLTSTRPDPPGGVIERDSSGLPTGILRETAVALIGDALADRVPPMEPEAVARALAGLPSLGLLRLTAIVSASGPLWSQGRDEVGLLATIAPDLPVDLDVLVIASDPVDLERAARTLSSADPRVRFAGWKEFADGSLGGHTAAMYDGFSDRPQERGILRLEPERAAEMARAALALGGAVAIHAIGDLANDAVLDLFEALIRHGADPSRLRIEHASVLTPEAIGRAAALGITLSVQPAFIASEQGWLERRLGPTRLRRTYPFASLIDQGVGLLGGSDCPVEPPNPWWGMAAARNRGSLAAEQALDGSRALGLFANAPRPGDAADLLVVDRDPVEAPPARMRETRVLAAYRSGVLTELQPELAFS